LVDVAPREAVPGGLLELLAGHATIVVLIEAGDHPVDPARHTRLDAGLDLARVDRAVGVQVELLEAPRHTTLTPTAMTPFTAMAVPAVMVMTVPAPAAFTAAPLVVIVVGSLGPAGAA